MKEIWVNIIISGKNKFEMGIGENAKINWHE